MADVFSAKKRSAIMRRVLSVKNRSTELELISLFRRKGIKGWRRNCKLYGSPDFVFPVAKIALFADGCFWHGHNCRNTKPKTNREFWSNKIKRNKNRDKKVNLYLRKLGWQVIRIWECAIKRKNLPQALSAVRALHITVLLA